MDRLVDAFLSFQLSDDGKDPPAAADVAADETTGGRIEFVDIFCELVLFFNPFIPSQYFFTDRRKGTFTTCPPHIYPNEALIQLGFIGCSPLFPTVAISLRTLACFRQAHRACPRFSIQAQCKMLCHMHNVLLSLNF
jgi:hypothetical protein